MNKEAADIVMFLNTSENSPYKGILEPPYSRRHEFMRYSEISPSIFRCINKFYYFNVPMDKHKIVFLNYLIFIKNNYDDDWYSNKNLLRMVPGFIATIYVLELLLKDAFLRKNFSQESFNSFFIKRVNLDYDKIYILMPQRLMEYVFTELTKCLHKEYATYIEATY